MARNLRIAPSIPTPPGDTETLPRPGTLRGESMASGSDGDGRDPDQRLGHILVELGRMRLDQVEAVLSQQGLRQRRFGDLAVALGLVARSDIDLALARQFDVDFLPAQESPPLDAGPGFAPHGHQRHKEVLRAVRSQLLLRWFGHAPEQRTLAVLSPDGGQGRSHVCAELGRLFAQLDEDTLLIDADLRRPSLHHRLGVDSGPGLAEYLHHEVLRPPIHAVPGAGRLHLLAAGASGADDQALLERREFALLLGHLARRYAFILIDTPPASQYSEAVTAAVRASGCLLVTRLHRTRVADVKRLSDQLQRHGVEVLGAVLNER